jgi:hypothetical protein
MISIWKFKRELELNPYISIECLMMSQKLTCVSTILVIGASEINSIATKQLIKI